MPISLDHLNAAPAPEFVAALGEIFEHAPWVAEAVTSQRPFATVTALHAAMINAVRASPAETQIGFLRGHPDLAGKAARAGDIAEASKSEQAGLGLDRLSDADYDEMLRLNTAYTEKFGFPFIVCVRRKTRVAVIADFVRRIGNDRTAELNAALGEIGYITRLRLADAVTGPGMPDVAGHLSTHVLDSYHGQPAGDVAITLFEIGREGERTALKVTRTNDNGRTDEPLLHGGPLRAGQYELLFEIGDYFRTRGVKLPDQPFLDDVVLRFGIDAPEGRYHVPLVATPWSYSTYRGS
ncbi:uric acid degradation bifunctional protein PucL [Variibacter gotjawalensis]|uniref:Uric acid degradation bifunctional protein PucL n=1 Tax=Variibacter gotjawalensis TaxID=1333996 RepID=A0A0S3PVK7_9BRAD|nr:2-oxo-4-hydroxy-4-carboxy-5-ureidoimidazoline decarboxylase [Variibacter gotjawalensis]NIK45762.1 2-oxo-4-hydroxy-4-carboxy-5-ureidoimidazoline decarboxylase [Variibacter gotjawalensis]RZS47686.1 2-oxo-4-hydroxy-4-carboxy-5-ureidoimidazoline decarboxylase [Variibacter gotjawalensis]BAT59939.1 uric acid degradation bifunctional protein PucL [Variibacter gotjawalensis]